MAQSSPGDHRFDGALETEQGASHGYFKLASLMASSPELAIIRQFRELQMLNLMRLQAKLQELEKEYRDTVLEDAASGDRERVNLINDFRQMRELAESEDGESEQYDLLEKIKVTLKEYSKH